MKKIIFYRPVEMSERISKQSGSYIRPEQMRRAFMDLGYEIIDVSGSISNRKRNIDAVINDIRNVPVEFMYIESANIPMALSNASHWPIHPFADLINIIKLKKFIKIGMFYRDVHWKYKGFLKEVGIIKGIVLIILNNFEFYFLKQFLNCIFVPSVEFVEMLPKIRGKAEYIPLPPACTEPFIDAYISQEKNQTENETIKLSILYSGNIDHNSLYNIENLLRVLVHSDLSIKLTINTAREDYLRNIDYYQEALSFLDPNKINFEHINYESANALGTHYSVAIVWLDDVFEEIRICMPIKLFYYIRMGLPVIGRRNTAYGDFIVLNDIGWVYSSHQELHDLLLRLGNFPDEIDKKHKNVINIQQFNTWRARAKKVEKFLI